MTHSSKPEKTVAFIVARLSSSRLPAKHFRKIGDRPLLQWVLDRLKDCREVDEIVLATVAEPDNLSLRDVAENNGVSFFWYEGEVDHVTTRLRCAAEAHAADICVLVSGDCPLIHAPAIDRMVRVLKNDPLADTVKVVSDSKGQPSALQGIVANRKEAWQLADDLSDRPELKEHQFPILWQRPDLFQSVDVRLSPDCYGTYHRLSVDTLADVDFMNAIYDVLAEQRKPFQLPEMVALLEERPDLKKINAHVHQCRLVENKKKVLFAVDAGGGYGYGHLMRCLELARQLTERLAWATHFFVDDRHSRTIIEETGSKAYWGAFGRTAKPNGNHDPSTIEEMLSGYDLLVIDIFDQRKPNGDWRKHFPKDIGCVVIENQQPWAREADMIVAPNMLGDYAFSTSSDQPTDAGQYRGNTKPRIVGGENFVILRNEVQRLASEKPKKEIDVLVYLHDRDRRESIRKILGKLDLKVAVIDAFEQRFLSLLAKSRVYISGFGISFNEALALGAIPVCWPDSDAHRKDAKNFYKQLGIDPLIINSRTDVEAVVSGALNQRNNQSAAIRDGTPNIVAEIEAFFNR